MSLGLVRPLAIDARKSRLSELSPRALLILALTLISLLSAAGFTARGLFTADTTFKQLVTVAVPVALLVVVSTRRPLMTLTGAAVIAAPLDLQITVGGIGVTPLDALLALAWPIAYLTTDRATRPATSWVGRVSIVAALGIAIPFVNASSTGEFAHLFIAMAATGYLTAHVAMDSEGRVFVLRSLVIGATIPAIAALYEVHTRTLLNLYSAAGSAQPSSTYFFGYETTFRPAGTLPDPIALGNVLAAGLVLAIAAVLTSRTWRQKFLWAACGMLISLALIFSLSRTSWIGAVVGVAVLLLTVPRRRALPTLAGIGLSMAVVIGVAFAADGKALIDRYHSISNPTSSAYSTADGDKTRLQIWKAALHVADQHPVAGVGFGKIPGALYGKVQGSGIGIHAHSTYFNVLAEGGGLGAGALLLVIAATISDGARQLKRHRTVAAGVLGAFTAILVGWTTDYTIRNLSVAAFVAAIVGLAACPGLRQRANT